MRAKHVGMLIPLGVFLGVVGIIVLFASTYTVGAGERGVLLTFGKPEMVAQGEGLHFKIPFVQSVAKMDVKTQKYEAEASSASQDLQIVSTRIAVNFRLSAENVPEIYQTIGLGYSDRIIQPAVQEVVKATTAEYTAEELITRRADVKHDIFQALNERLTLRGIIVEEISITDFDFSETFNAAIESKVTAEQLKLKAERDLQRIEVEAKQAEAQAIGQKNAAIAKAQGEAEAIRVIDEQLRESPTYIEFLKIQKWDGELPRVTGGAVPFIDIGTVEE